MQDKNDPKFEREWIKPDLPEIKASDKLSLRLAHWNILAAKLGTPESFPNIKEKIPRLEATSW